MIYGRDERGRFILKGAKKMAETQGYTTDKWAGKPKYNCSECSYDTLVKEDVETHVRLSHRAQPTVAAVTKDKE